MPEVDVEYLIALIQCRPVLWDKNSNDYRDRIKTKNAWREICEEIQPGKSEEEQKDLSKSSTLFICIIQNKH